MRKTDQFVLFLFARKTQTLVPTDFKGHPNIKFLSLPESMEATLEKVLDDKKFIELVKGFFTSPNDISSAMATLMSEAVSDIAKFEIEIEGRTRPLSKLGATLGQLRVVIDGTPTLFQMSFMEELKRSLAEDCACTFVDNTLVSLEYGHIIYIGE